MWDVLAAATGSGSRHAVQLSQAKIRAATAPFGCSSHSSVSGLDRNLLGEGKDEENVLRSSCSLAAAMGPAGRALCFVVP